MLKLLYFYAVGPVMHMHISPRLHFAAKKTYRAPWLVAFGTSANTESWNCPSTICAPPISEMNCSFRPISSPRTKIGPGDTDDGDEAEDDVAAVVVAPEILDMDEEELLKLHDFHPDSRRDGVPTNRRALGVLGEFSMLLTSSASLTFRNGDEHARLSKRSDTGNSKGEYGKNEKAKFGASSGFETD
jgi:hypothetical protein